MALSAAVLEKGLVKKGFQKRHGNHLFFVYYGIDGTKSGVQTMISHGAKSKTLSDDLVSQMARQCALPRGKFEDLINCPLQREDYEELLRQAGKL